MGFRVIGRILKISYATVYLWVIKLGESVDMTKAEKPVAVVEIDEMHSYVGRKDYCLVWIAVDRYGRRVVDFVYGRHNTLTFQRNVESNIRNGPGRFLQRWLEELRTNHPPAEAQCHEKSTFTAEGYNSRIRHYLARFKRKTKCYSKSQHMMEISLKLLFLKWNNLLKTLFVKQYHQKK